MALAEAQVGGNAGNIQRIPVPALPGFWDERGEVKDVADWVNQFDAYMECARSNQPQGLRLGNRKKNILLTSNLENGDSHGERRLPWKTKIPSEDKGSHEGRSFPLRTETPMKDGDPMEDEDPTEDGDPTEEEETIPRGRRYPNDSREECQEEGDPGR